MGIFDLNTPEEFFYSICRILEQYKISTAKNIEDLLYILMGLNHLREWIAPGYDWKKPPKSPNEEFYQFIYKNSEFKTVNALCNRTKHLNPIRQKSSSEHDLKFDDWPDFDSVRNFDLGPASNYLVDGKNIINVLDDLVEYYKKNWFDIQNQCK